MTKLFVHCYGIKLPCKDNRKKHIESPLILKHPRLFPESNKKRENYMGQNRF